MVQEAGTPRQCTSIYYERLRQRSETARADLAWIEALPPGEAVEFLKKRTVKAPTTSEVRAQKPEIITWTGEQLSTFLAWNRNELKDELFPLWRLIAYSSMRRSEALALKWSDINTKAM